MANPSLTAEPQAPAQREPHSTPQSWRPAWARFSAQVEARLERGERLFGTAGFARPAPALLAEVLEELVDVAGWAVVLHARLLPLRDVIEAAERDKDGRGATQ